MDRGVRFTSEQATQIGISLDTFMQLLMRRSHSFTSEGKVLPMQISIVNTVGSRHQGVHWFVVAHSFGTFERGGREAPEGGTERGASHQNLRPGEVPWEGL